MSAVIVGSPSSSATATNAKVLRRQNYEKTSVGLEIINETYLIRTENLIALTPAKDTTHSSYSTAASKYARMAVESVSSNEDEGGITQLNVSYVGLTSSSGLPPAIVNIIPVTGAGVVGPPINIEVEFVSDLAVQLIVQGQFSSLSPNIFGANNGPQRMPTSINGTSLPPNPRTPYTFQGTSSVSSTYARYEGYVLNNIEATRRGQFHLCRATFAEYFVTGAGISGGWANRFGSA